MASLGVKALVVVGASVAVGLAHAWIHKPIVLAVKPSDANGRTPGPAPIEYHPELDSVLQPGEPTSDEPPEFDPDASSGGPAPASTDGSSQAAGNPGTGNSQPAIDPGSFGVEIHVAEARWIFENEVKRGTAQFIDARPTAEYVEGHVSGAMSVVPGAFRNGTPGKIKDFLDPSQRIVVYCSGGDCDASHQVGTFLQAAGFSRVHLFVDGFDAWGQAHPKDVQKGNDPFGP